MTDIQGQWDSVAQSPMGEQKSLLTLTGAPDGSFGGTSAGPMGEADVFDGSVEGDRVRFSIRMTKPFPMTLTVTGTLASDTIEGQIDTGAFGTFPMKASRRA